MLDRLIDAFSPLALRHLWQVTLTVAVLLILARAIGRKSAHWAYALLIVAALKCLCPPVWSLAIAPFCWWGDPVGRPSQAVRQSMNESDTVASISKTVTDMDSAGSFDESTTLDPSEDVSAGSSENNSAVEYPSNDKFASSENTTSKPATPSETAIASTLVPPSADEAHAPGGTIDWPRVLQAGLILTWLIGSGLLLAGIIVKRRRLASLVARGSVVTEGATFDLVDQLRVDLELDVKLNVVILDEPGIPGVFGVRHPTVVLPRVVLQRMSDNELRLVLAHELNHLRRQDTVCGAVQLLAQVIWWFHPLVWWMNSHLRRYREHCCDEEVVARLRCRPGEYARCLLNVLSLRQELRPVIGVSALSPFDVTAQRLKNLMRQQRSFSRHRSWLCLSVSVLLAAILLPGAALPRGTSVETAARSLSLPELDSDGDDAKVTRIYRSGIAEIELADSAAEPQAEPAPPELTYQFHPHESPAYLITINADEPMGTTTLEGTITWSVNDLSDADMTISRLPTAIMRTQTPRPNGEFFVMPAIPSVTWHNMHGPVGPAAMPEFAGPSFPARIEMTPPGWPSHLGEFGPSRQQHATMSAHHPGDLFPDTPFGLPEPDRFSLAGGATHLGDPCWLPYGLGDAIDWILAPLPDSLDGGSTDRSMTWSVDVANRLPGLPQRAFTEQAHEWAAWHLVERGETEWVLTRDLSRWSPDAGDGARPENPRCELSGSAIITWDIAQGRPLGIEFAGQFIRNDDSAPSRIPVTVHVAASE